MPFNNSIPQPTDRISDSQAPILANFAAIKTVVDINHVTFDDASGDQGKHKWVTFPEQAATPVTAANEMAIFSRLSTLSAQTELAVVNEGAGDVYEFTSAGKTATGWAMLPSGILIKWGFSAPTTGLSTMTWPVAATIPVFSSVFNVVISPLEATAGDVDTAVRLVSFGTTTVVGYVSKRTTVGISTDATVLYFVAIGIPV